MRDRAEGKRLTWVLLCGSLTLQDYLLWSVLPPSSLSGNIISTDL